MVLEKDGNSIEYNGISIDEKEVLKENVFDEHNLPYIQENGTKYYYDENNEVFSIISGEKKYINSNIKNNYIVKIEDNASAYNYYNLASEFTKLVRGNNILNNLKFSDAYSEDGNEKISEKYSNTKLSTVAGFNGNEKIFERNSVNIEESDSNFNEHRTAVIRYAIQRNLSLAIADFNQQSSLTNEFQMPELSETEWYSIINNISTISFLQGMSIGGRMYNGHSVVVNNKNKEVVSEDSIYIAETEPETEPDTAYYHKVNAEHLLSSEKDLSIGVYNIDFERRSFIDSDTLLTTYYYPKKHLGCYDCVINSSDVKEDNTDILKYVKTLAKSGVAEKESIAKLYYTALGRERYSMNRTTYETYANNLQEGGTWKYCKLTTQ